MGGWLRRHWFVIGLAVAVAAAMLLPASVGWGSLSTAALRDALVAGVFFCTGVLLDGRRLLAAGRAWPRHLGVQGLNLGLVPLLGLLAAPLWQAGLPPAVADGLLIALLVPTTITSCLIFTGLARGDQELALINTVLGNLLGLILTPAWILIALERSGELPVAAIAGKLTLLVILPLLVGQGFRWRRPPSERRRRQLAIVNQTALLGIVYLAGSASFAGGSPLPAVQWLQLIAWCLGLRLALLLVGELAGRLLRWPRPARVVLLFAGTEKTLALGLRCLPLIVYHPLQLLVDAAIASRLGKNRRQEELVR